MDQLTPLTMGGKVHPEGGYAMWVCRRLGEKSFSFWVETFFFIKNMKLADLEGSKWKLYIVKPREKLRTGKGSFGTTGLMPGLFWILVRKEWNRQCHWILVNIHSWTGSKPLDMKTCVRQHKEQKQGFNRISTIKFTSSNSSNIQTFHIRHIQIVPQCTIAII